MAMQESIGAPAPLGADPDWPPNPSGKSSSQSQHPLDDSQIEAQTRTAVDEAENEAERLRRLYNAAKNGDWKTAESIVRDNRNLWLEKLTPVTEDTALMVAARSFKWEFVEKLVKLLDSGELEMGNSVDYTVLHFVANSGSVKTAEILVRKCSGLTQMVSKDGATPLLLSVRRSLHKDMIWYLALVTSLDVGSARRNLSNELFRSLTFSGFHDITMYLLDRYKGQVNFSLDPTDHLLIWLSGVPLNAHINKKSLTFIERWLYKFIHVKIGEPPHSLRNKEGVSPLTPPEPSRSFLSQELHCLKMLLWKASEKLVPGLKRVREAKLQHRCVEKLVEKYCIEFGTNFSFDEVTCTLKSAIYLATVFGHVEIVRICLEHFPDLIFKWDQQDRNLLHVAALYRQEEIFNLITEIPVTGALLANKRDRSGNTVWHCSAKLAAPSKLLLVSGAALQMQRELQWFTEVQKLIEPRNIPTADDKLESAAEVFLNNHMKLAVEGEKWMKDTAHSCMIVATLIATVVFAAAFTVPGGNVGDTGIPVFLQRTDFLVFAISDALALLSSSTSLLMFLSILTATYRPQDFLLKLPKRLIIGLGSLFFAIITMMVAFGAALYMLLKDRWESVYIPIFALSCMPVLIFAKLQLPLFYAMVQSTYGSGVFKKKKTGDSLSSGNDPFEHLIILFD